MSRNNGEMVSGQPSPYSEVHAVRAPAKIALNVDSIGRGTIVVNGIDLSSIVSSTRLYSGVGQLTEVELEIKASSLTVEMEAALRIYIVKDGADVTSHGDQFRRFARGGYAGAEQE